MMILLLIGVVYYVVYIFRMAYAENEVPDSADSNFEHDDSSCTEQETGVVQSGTGKQIAQDLQIPVEKAEHNLISLEKEGFLTRKGKRLTIA